MTLLSVREFCRPRFIGENYKCYDQRVRSNADSVFISIDTSSVCALVLSFGSTLCLLWLGVKFDDLYFSVCGDVKKLLQHCWRDVLVIVDEAMHRSLVDLELTLNLGLSQMIIMK